MIAPRMKRSAALLGVCSACSLFASVAFGQAGQPYSSYRQSLIAEGWSPVTSYGLKTGSGKALYKFPEIICGPELCNAKWRDRQGRVQLIKLIRGRDAADHQVAPQ